MWNSRDPLESRAARRETRQFAARLLLAMALLTAVAGAVAVLLARRHLAEVQTREAGLRFAVGEAGDRALRHLRAEALEERASLLARRPRIHAALEDDALDLLYLAAHDDLRDALAPRGSASPPFSESNFIAPSPLSSRPFRARFYRFYDATGKLIVPPPVVDAGPTSPAELTAAAALVASPIAPAAALHSDWVLESLTDSAGLTSPATELLALPIRSNADGRRLGVLVLGYPLLGDARSSSTFRARAPTATASPSDDTLAICGLWRDGRLLAPTLPPALGSEAESKLRSTLAATNATTGDLRLRLGGADWLVFHQLVHSTATPGGARALNFFPLDALARRQRELTWRIAGTSALLALAGLLASALLTLRFSGWFGRLAQDSVAQRAGRVEAETHLRRTAAELARSARFSSDASHQLKTPVAVLRIGLDELAATAGFPAERQSDIDELRQQTDRLGHIVDDLLLLARLDAGLVRIAPAPVDLAALAASALDDISVLPEAETLRLENTLRGPLIARAERGHLALVLQNLLENAAKYNQPGGLVRLSGETAPGWLRLRVENTAPHPVPPEARELIFERFHRGAAGAAVTPGHGLGLNLARELARLHGGDLRLLHSTAERTVFELSLPT